MTILMIYLAGCLMVLAIGCARLYKKGRVEVYDVLECAFLAICSWATLLEFVMVMIGNNLDKVLRERKEDRQHELLGITPEDYKFLKELQHELNTQDSDGQADPVYWSVMETRSMPAAEGCGEAFVYMGDGMLMTPQEVVTFVQENGYLGDLDDRQKTQWEELNKDDARELVDFLHEAFEWYYARVVYLEQQEGISHETGAFLTKRACKEYIERFGYNHSQPRTYAMTAYRNRELAEFLRIFRSIKL